MWVQVLQFIQQLTIIEYFKGKNLIILNETPTSRDDIATLVIRERFAQVMTEVMNILKANASTLSARLAKFLSK